jgi:hypothetical protein
MRFARIDLFTPKDCVTWNKTVFILNKLDLISEYDAILMTVLPNWYKTT